MEAISGVIGRIMKRALAGSGRTIVDAVLADGIDNGSEKQESVIATGSDFAWSSSLDEVLPVLPAARAMETPLANTAPRDEQSPCGTAGGEFNAMSSGSPAKHDGTTPPVTRDVGVLPLVHELEIEPLQNDTDIPPRMIVKGAVIVGVSEVVQIDVEPLVPRDDPPAFEVGIVRRSNDEVGFPHDVLNEKERSLSRNPGTDEVRSTARLGPSVDRAEETTSMLAVDNEDCGPEGPGASTAEAMAPTRLE